MSLDRPKAADPTWRTLVLLLALTTLGRLLMAGLLDLVSDEAYALGVSRPFQWSFYDHPPLAFWIVGLMQTLFGRELAPVLARLPFVLMFTASTWAMFALTARLYGERAGLWAAGFLNVTPFFFVSAGSWIVPDGPLVLGLLLAALCFVRALADERHPWAAWIGVGVFAGLALLSKYQAGIVVLGALAVLLLPPNRHWLRRPQPYAAAVVALALFTPVLWWNASHGWISFEFQFGRGAGPAHFDFAHGLTLFLGEALYLLPWILVTLVAAAIVARGTGRRLLLWLGAPLIVLFNVLAFTQPGGLPHWSMPGWLFLFPLLGRVAAEAAARRQRWPAILAGISLVALAGLCISAVLFLSNWRIYAGGALLDGPMVEATSWTGVRDGLASKGLLDRPNTFLGAMNWLEGARLAEALRPENPVAVFGDDPRGFAFLSDVNSRLGQDALVVVDPGSATATSGFLGRYFASVETIGTFETFKGGRPAFSSTVLLAHDFTQPIKIPYGLGASVSAR
jgi:4-amino-4-deoxy-L-arabinose transferase-like glycosyltransferase